MSFSRRPVLSRALWALITFAACRSQPAPVVVVPAPPIVPAEPPRVAWTQGPLASAKVPPGGLMGIVVDAATGEPLMYTQIFARRGHTSVVTDTNGTFRLALPNGAASVLARRIGYESVSMDISTQADSGYVAVFALRPSLLSPCSVSVGGPVSFPGVVVRVRDALTGTAPAGLVAVTVRDGAFRDSVAVRADSAQRLWASAALDRPGRYDVTVRSSRHRDWHGQGATRLIPGCSGEFSAAVLHAWLIPK